MHRIITASFALALSACTARHTHDSSDDAADGGSSSGELESTGAAETTATSEGTTADGTTGAGAVCIGEPFDVDGWWVSGCCDAPLPEITCSAWCEAHGFGECLFLHTTNTGHCEPYGGGINQLGLCDVDMWTYLPAESLDGLVMRCVCDSP